MPELKDPKDRAHVWERPARADEQALEAVAHDYAHELPRYLHNAAGDVLLVSTPIEADEALANGFYVNPNDIPAEAPAVESDEADAPAEKAPRKSRKA